MLKKFIENEALEMLQEQELVLLNGGHSEEGNSTNAVADCRNTNCHGANCVSGCGASSPIKSIAP